MAFLRGLNIRNIVKGVRQLSDGTYWYKTGIERASFESDLSDEEKITYILKSPIGLKVIDQIAKLYSLGEYELVRKVRNGDKIEEEIIDDHVLLDRLKYPNHKQSQTQFDYDYIFWRLMGTANLALSSKILDENLEMEWLKPHLIEWPKWFDDHRDYILMDSKMQAERDKKVVKYNYLSNKQQSIIYDRIIQFFDISNGISSWYEGPSRIDAAYKLLSNAELLLKAENVTAHFLRKFMVGSNVSVSETKKLNMSPIEKQAAKEMLHDDNPIHYYQEPP